MMNQTRLDGNEEKPVAPSGNYLRDLVPRHYCTTLYEHCNMSPVWGIELNAKVIAFPVRV
jgi:hypothetical protein